MPNQLIHETSPYLLQHAHNPVDWYPWKEAALEKAKRENKPILVSIGYSTCHWCHVMERESFEHEDVAAVMNAYFVNIKVDREERPDVDAIYMEACQILTGSGGWPLNCFLTPDGRPFYAGTYFPPRSAYGRPSWGQVLQHIARTWREEPDKVDEQANRLMEAIQRNEGLFFSKKEESATENPLNRLYADAGTPFLPPSIEAIFYKVRDRFDRVDGGFGAAPKFPSTMAITFLLRYAFFQNNQEALNHALFSLQKMCEGGIYDQLGGGFARYATDSAWLIPHFEKMLYDNALLVKNLAEALRFLKGSVGRETVKSELPSYHTRLFTKTLKETLAFIQREMMHPAGGFYSAYDADSEGVEGKFYVWERQEVDALLGEDSELFCAFYDIHEGGNWEGHSILWQPTALENFARERGLEISYIEQKLSEGRTILFEERKKRVPPGLDDKVLLGWNALMISGFVEAYRALGDEDYLTLAKRSFEFVEKNFVQAEEGRLFHTWKDGEAQYDAYLDDYAYTIAALLDLYETDFADDYLWKAEKYTQHVLSYFSSGEGAPYYYTASYQKGLVLRRRDAYDNATPSGNSTMVQNLQRLALHLDKPEWKKQAISMLQTMQPSVEKYSLSFMRWASALAWEVYPPTEVAIVGATAKQKARDINSYFWPNKIIAASESAIGQLPLLRDKPSDSDALIYCCKNYACQRPVQTVEEIIQ